MWWLVRSSDRLLLICSVTASIVQSCSTDVLQSVDFSLEVRAEAIAYGVQQICNTPWQYAIITSWGLPPHKKTLGVSSTKREKKIRPYANGRRVSLKFL